jgi:hypothetical protein
MRNEVKEFAEEMEYKLSLHDDRPGWKECDSKWLIARLKEEIAEVEKVLAEKGDGWLSRLFQECADVGNFAMMIQDAERWQWAKRFAEEYDGPLPD